jgi:hypothetical protein
MTGILCWAGLSASLSFQQLNPGEIISDVNSEPRIYYSKSCYGLMKNKLESQNSLLVEHRLLMLSKAQTVILG